MGHEHILEMHNSDAISLCAQISADTFVLVNGETLLVTMIKYGEQCMFIVKHIFLYEGLT